MIYTLLSLTACLTQRHGILDRPVQSGRKFGSNREFLLRCGCAIPSRNRLQLNNDELRIYYYFYKNVLGRTVTASDAGVQYWAGEIASGRQSRGKVVNSIIASARTYKNDPTWGWVANLLDNKLTISKLFCLKLRFGYKTPQLNIINGKAIANAVTPTDVEAAKRLINMTDTGFNLLN